MDKTGPEKKHLKNGPLIFLIFLGLFVVSVGWHNYEQYYVLKDYPVSAMTSCDPLVNSCFIIDEELAFFSTQAGPYLKVRIQAYAAPTCLDEHNCENFTCRSLGGGCEITYCSEETKEEGEFCSNEIQ